MATLKMKLTMPAIPFKGGAGLTERIRRSFAKNAGAMIVAAVRAHLGQDAIYTLSTEYSARKPSLKGYRRITGKSKDQPLILTGEMFDALVWNVLGDGLEVHVDDSKAMDGSFDYAEWWEDITSYLELGLHDVEDQLDEVLADIVVSEMAL